MGANKFKIMSVGEIAAVGVLGACAWSHGKGAMKIAGLAATALLAWNAVNNARYAFAPPAPTT